jgi:hypothetical protein
MSVARVRSACYTTLGGEEHPPGGIASADMGTRGIEGSKEGDPEVGGGDSDASPPGGAPTERAADTTRADRPWVRVELRGVLWCVLRSDRDRPVAQFLQKADAESYARHYAQHERVRLSVGDEPLPGDG